jgi:hypothetical protein
MQTVADEEASEKSCVFEDIIIHTSTRTNNTGVGCCMGEQVVKENISS